MNEDIAVFICEDEKVAKEIIARYFNSRQVTYAAVFAPSNREKIVSLLDNVEAV